MYGLTWMFLACISFSQTLVLIAVCALFHFILLYQQSDNAVVFGDDAQSNAVARALDSKGWTVKVVTTKKCVVMKRGFLQTVIF